MRLQELLSYREIIIQCHDNPDADTISSAYGVYLYYRSKGVQVRIIYSGRDRIKRTNLKMLITELNIPIEYVLKLEKKPEILITVDCQYEEGNVTYYEANKVAVIDHHQDCNRKRDFAEIRSEYGSCATLVYRMLKEEDYPILNDQKLMTALYFGLYMDTNGFSEMRHICDYDLVEEVVPLNDLFIKLKNSNFTFLELEIAASALLRCEYIKEERVAIAKANACDPNLLGFISDMVLQVEGVDTVIAFCEFEYAIRFSVRNINPLATSRDIVKYLTEEIGTGGGHENKAGGNIIMSQFEQVHKDTSVLMYFLNSMRDYFQDYDIVDTNSTNEFQEMKLYEKIPVKFRMIQTRDFGEIGEQIEVSSLHQNIDLVIDENTYLMVDCYGEIFEISKECFEEQYKLVEEPYECIAEEEPVVKLRKSEVRIHLPKATEYYRSKNQRYVIAQQLVRRVKLTDTCESRKYSLGELGDYIAYKQNDPEKKLFIIKKADMQEYYRLV